MAETIGDIFRELDFYEYHQIFLSSNYYEVLFPFLLLFAVYYSVLSSKKLTFFKSKNTGKPFSSVISIISLVVSFYSVNFQISDEHTIATLMMMLFPNISALTIAILTFYIVGAILGKDFFKGVFDKKNTAFLYIAIGGIGLGAVLYYVGIAMGFWDFDPFDAGSRWNFILALFFLILGITFLFIDMAAIGILLLLVFGAYVVNSGDELVLSYFVDPVVFIIIIIILLLAWLNSEGEDKGMLAKKLRDSENTLAEFEKKNGRKPDDYNARIYDIVDSNYNSNLNKWKNKYGGENWK